MIRTLLAKSRLTRPAFFVWPQALSFWPRALPFLSLALILAACGEPPPEQIRLTGATMGTRYHITWMAHPNDPEPEAIHIGVEAVLEEVNASMSTWRDGSEITRFNASEPGEWFAVSGEFADVFEMARTVSVASGGAYDVTVGPLVDLWGFGPAMGEIIPDQEDVDEAMQQVGQQRIEFDRQAPALRKSSTMALDYSSIAKGYGVDRVAEWLETQGIHRYLVEIGGEIRVSGDNPHGSPWRIAVEKPDSTTREVIATVRLEDAAIATSGDYRNYFEVDGVRYSHTIDPRTGRPVRHDLVSVTVIHPSATMADAWATALTVLGTKKALEVARNEELAVYLISRDGDDFRTSSSPAMAPLLGME